MKTTVDIPESLYQKAKIRAVERRETLKQFVIEALRRQLEVVATPEEKRSFSDRRRLIPEYKKAMKEGAFRVARGERDVTELISEDRDVR